MVYTHYHVSLNAESESGCQRLLDAPACAVLAAAGRQRKLRVRNARRAPFSSLSAVARETMGFSDSL